MAQDLIKLAEQAEAAAEELPSVHEAAVASRQAERVVRRLRDSAQQLSVVVADGNGSEPPATGPQRQSRETATVG
jgi:plasmid stabilization system protein ParE